MFRYFIIIGMLGSICIFSNVGVCSGLYQKEIKLVKEQFSAYLYQNEKNINALTKLVQAYERANDAMDHVIHARKELQPNCPRNDSKKMLDCVGKQNAAISMLEFYVLSGEKIMLDVVEDAREAGRILGQDVSDHVAALQKIQNGFQKWKTVNIVDLKKQAEADRRVLGKLYSDDLKGQYMQTAYETTAVQEAAFLAGDIRRAAKAIRIRGQHWIDQHRIPHAKLSVASLIWLKKQVPVMWNVLNPFAKQHPLASRALAESVAAVQMEHDSLVGMISAKDEAVERNAAVKTLREKLEKISLNPSQKRELDANFAAIEELSRDPQKKAQADVIVERLFVWVEAVAL